MQNFSYAEWELSINLTEDEQQFFQQKIQSQTIQEQIIQNQTCSDDKIIYLINILSQIKETENVLDCYHKLICEYQIDFDNLENARVKLIDKINNLYSESSTLIQQQKNLINLNEIIQENIQQYKNSQKLENEMEQIYNQDKQMYEGNLQRMYSEIYEGIIFFETNYNFKDASQQLKRYYNLKYKIISITKQLFLKIFNKYSQQIEGDKLQDQFPEMNDSLITKKLQNLLDYLELQSKYDDDLSQVLKEIFVQYYNYYRIEQAKRFIKEISKQKQRQFQDLFDLINTYCNLEIQNYKFIFNNNKQIDLEKVQPLMIEIFSLFSIQIQQNYFQNNTNQIIDDINLIKQDCKFEDLRAKIIKEFKNRLYQQIQMNINDIVNLQLDQIQLLLCKLQEIFESEIYLKIRNQIVFMLTNQVKISSQKIEDKLDQFIYFITQLSQIKSKFLQTEINFQEIKDQDSYDNNKSIWDLIKNIYHKIPQILDNQNIDSMIDDHVNNSFVKFIYETSFILSQNLYDYLEKYQFMEMKDQLISEQHVSKTYEMFIETIMSGFEEIGIKIKNIDIQFKQEILKYWYQIYILVKEL